MIQALFSSLMYHLHGWQALFRLYRFLTGRTAIAVFMYHRVVREQSPNYLQGYEKGLAERDYLAQLGEIEKIFRVISLDEFTKIASGESKPDTWKPLALLTYDDGDSENLTLAFPPLWKKALPAVSFIATDFIDSSRRFYHLRVTNALNNLNDDGWKKAAQVPMPVSMRRVFESFAPDYRPNKYPIRRALIGPMDILPPAERDSIIDKWEALAGGTYTLGIECMSWKEICSLPARGIDIGSHTVNHNKLELVPIDEARRELTESKSILESRLNRPVTAICYPQGSFNDDILIEAEKSGYQTGFTTIPGLVDYPLDSREQLAVPRIGMGRGKSHQIVYPLGKALLTHLRSSRRRPQVK